MSIATELPEEWSATYRLPRAVRIAAWGYPALGLAGAACVIWLTWTLAELPAWFKVACLGGGLAFTGGLIFAAMGFQRAYLAVSAEGLVFQAAGYRIRAPWEAVIGIGTVPNGMTGGKVRGLLLHGGTCEVRPWLRAWERLRSPVATFAQASGQTVGTPVAMEEYRAVIPVGGFVRDWESAPLGAAIRRRTRLTDAHITGQSEDGAARETAINRRRGRRNQAGY